MELLIENYKIILCIGIFIVFALIGYIVETLKKDNKEDNQPLETENIDEIKIDEIKSTQSEIKEENEEETNIMIDKSDDLLNDYNNIK